MLSPLNFGAGILVVAGGVLLYTLWSGFRASVLTDFAQVVAMLGAAVVVIPIVFFAAGGPGMFEAGVAAGHVTPQQESFFSSEAFMNQGAPYIAAVLAYAIGNQTIAQRLFAVREDLIRPTFVTAMVGYADGYGQSVGRRAADPRTMLLIGRLTMIVATAAALYFATSQFNILDLLVFVGACGAASSSRSSPASTGPRSPTPPSRCPSWRRWRSSCPSGSGGCRPSGRGAWSSSCWRRWGSAWCSASWRSASSVCARQAGRRVI